MRFGNVLLGLVTLTCLHISRGQQCNNGLAGFQNGDACCDPDCGACGGSRCGRLPGGSMNCCTGQITNSGVMCSTAMAAPCIIDNPVLCSNGLPGVETNGVCCEAQCGTCGGSGCGRRDGGASACCSSRIEESGVLCSMSDAAPCIIDDGLVCSNGLPGVERSGVCCEAQCGTCGGSGCSSRSGGSSACCTGRIEESNVLCSTTMEAPCIIDGPAPPTPVPAPPTPAPSMEEGPAPPTPVPAPPTPAPSMEEGACNPNPCQNGGSCSIDPAGGHVCSCASGFGGMACQTDTSSLGSFFIELVFVGTWTDERMAVFESAAERWSEVVTHVPCGGNAIFPAGRLLITSTLQEIDGVGGTLGSAGPESVWSGCTSISIEGNMRFDTADIANLEADGSFEGVVLHEMGHVIGVGTLWGEGFGECTTCRQTEDPAWMCPAALSAFADLGGSGADIVELDGGRGTSCVHLDEEIFEDELMTGFVDNPMFLSKVTTATLDDIDYIVDPSAADPYVLPSERGASIVADDIMPSVVNDTAVDATILVLDDDDGSVVEELTGVVIVF